MATKKQLKHVLKRIVENPEARIGGDIRAEAVAALYDKIQKRKANSWQRFDSEQYALGFAEGIKFANDSALEVLEVKKINGQWVVYMFDADMAGEADES